MQIPILNGIYSDEAADFRTAYPRNLVPVPKSQGISAGYLRPGDGIVAYGGVGPGVDRGGINWNGRCYRVMGTKLVAIDPDGSLTTIGDVGGAYQVTMDYSFNYLGITSSERFFLYDETTLTEVTDTDLGNPLDHIWVDGYFMLTDGEYLIVTELADSFNILPTKYGSSEADPDPIKALLKVRNEPYALNRYTIEVFDNVGGSGFPFARIEGAQVQRGTVGTHTCCNFLETIAFVGSGRDEALSVYLISGGNSISISTREIDQILNDYSEGIVAEVLVESRVDKAHQFLYIHLPDKTLVYDAAASQVVKEPVWFTLDSGLGSATQYKCRNLVRCYGKWLVGDPSSTNLGYLTDEVSTHWGQVVDWEFNTAIIYNESQGAIFHELELVSLTGRVNLGADPTIYTRYSLDGESWSMPKSIKVGKVGNRKKRLVWLSQGSMRSWRIQQFHGNSNTHISMSRLEARVEPLAV